MTSDPVTPSTGVGVLHLFCKPTPMFDAEAAVAAVKAAEASGCQAVTIATLGHKCDVAVMAVHENFANCVLATAVQRRPRVVDSYVSLSEVSEYAAQMPDEMKKPRLYPRSRRTMSTPRCRPGASIR
jgi:chlorite dismutase